MLVESINKVTGESLVFEVKNPDDAIFAWRTAQEFERQAKDIREQLKAFVLKYIPPMGLSEPFNGFAFRQSIVQRQEYDKSLLRDFFDEDVLDLMLKPDKKFIDQYIRENLKDLPPDVGELRKHMVNVGQPYEVIKLERVK